MLNKFLPLIILILIILLGSYLRLADLGIKPNGLYVDEASTGYNAWSILETSKDEYGKSFPLAFRFLGSYTPPLYTYLTSGAIYFLGLSVTSTRIISALSGILMILVIFILSKSLNISESKITPLLAALLVAISPWSIFYSRIGYEIHLAFLLYGLGVLFLWKGLENSKWLILGFGFLSLSTNAYHAERLLAHLTLIVFLIVFRRSIFIKKNRSNMVLSIGIYILFLVPQLLILFTPANTSRGLGLLYHLGLVDFIREFFAQYLSYFSPRNLFFYPDSDLQRSLPELSTFYPWMVILYGIGLVVLIKNRMKSASNFLIMLLLLNPIPAALTGDPFSTQRALPLLLPILLIISLGLDKLLNGKFRNQVLLITLIMIISSLLYLYRSYAVYLPNERAKVWGYGYEQLAKEIQKRPEQKFIIDSSRIKPAYIELAFYLKVPPEILQASVDQNIKMHYYGDIPWSGNYKLNNIETRQINFHDDIYQEQILVGDEFAISPSQMNEHFLIKEFEILSPNKEIIFIGYKTNPKLKCQKVKDVRCP